MKRPSLWVTLCLALTCYTGLAQSGPAASPTWVESSLAAAEVKPGAVVLRHVSTQAETITGFYIRLTHCIGPTEAPVVAAVRIRGKLHSERAIIPVYPFPLNQYTRTGGKAQPPIDVGQEYRTALTRSVTMAPGEVVTVELISTSPLVSGVTAGLQFQGSWPLAQMRQPFRAVRGAGPVSRVPWSAREVVCTGTQKKFDPLCAPQNNSGVVADDDGTLYQFTSYYSVDEQYGGGRDGSYARIFGYKKSPDGAWEALGLIVDPVDSGLTYAGDPFAFRDLDGTPCLAYTTANGTRGFVDWTLIDGRILRSTTKSFAGPWRKEPLTLYDNYPRREGSDGRMIGIRIYPRRATNDYLLLWQHGQRDIAVRGAVIPRLDVKLTHQQINQAPILVRNQEEGGGGFQRGDKGYLSTWQIPSVNDPTSLQRLYEFDLTDPLNPEKWRVMPGSWGFNDGTHGIEDGGATADSWSMSMIGDELWSTLVVWSVSEQKNSILACHVPWDQRQGDTFRYGGIRVPAFSEITPTIEYAVGEYGSLTLEFTSQGERAHAYVLLAPSAKSGRAGAVGLELSDEGAQLVAYADDETATALTSRQGPKWTADQTFKLKLQRSRDLIRAWVDGIEVGTANLRKAPQHARLTDPVCFKLYGSQGALYTIKDAVLVDGPDSD
mgnify:FL=1